MQSCLKEVPSKLHLLTYTNICYFQLSINTTCYISFNTYIHTHKRACMQILVYTYCVWYSRYRLCNTFTIYTSLCYYSLRGQLFFMFHIMCKNICVDSECNSTLDCNETQYCCTQMEIVTTILQKVRECWRDLKATVMQNSVCACVCVCVCVHQPLSTSMVALIWYKYYAPFTKKLISAHQ
jgi:hypothetical protein